MSRSLQQSFSPLVAAGFLLLTGQAAFGHYLWVASAEKPGEHGTVHVYFEEVPAPGDGGYLDPFVKQNKTWLRTLDNVKGREIELRETKEKDKRWLSAPAPLGGPRSIDCYGKFGVYRYGTTDVLLHYYARTLDIDDHDQLHELGSAEQMDLDIVLHEHDGKMEATVHWRGKPAANRPVYLRGPQKFRETLETNDKGMITFAPEAKGRYLLRTYVEEDQAGEDDGKAYVKIRHNATMVIDWPLGE
ncbi:MAG: hypothetical protein RIC55_15620 [Pirellulaceae bacterium]